MSKKYLGDTFDIHGGGMDLAATHHTNEIAQSHGCNHTNPVKYWMHTNMLTVNGARMSKSAGNGFLPNELFTGNHPLLEKEYSPMCVRFFMMQTHYRSTLDFSNEALKAAEKGYARLMNAVKTLQTLVASDSNTVDIDSIIASCYDAMNDDFNTPIALASLFDAVRIINSVNDGKEKISAENLEKLRQLITDFVFSIFGLQDESASGSNDELPYQLMELIIDIRATVKADKNYSMADKIRDGLKAIDIQIKDSKDGSSWERIKS